MHISYCSRRISDEKTTIFAGRRSLQRTLLILLLTITLVLIIIVIN